MAKVDVQAEVMDRALEAPDILANLTFGGTVVTTNGVGMIMNPLGLFSCNRAMKTCCCPSQVMPTIPYVNGDYTAGLQVDQAPPPCCKKTGFFSISTTDYTTVISQEKAGVLAGAALRRMQESGASPAALAKAFPDTVKLGKTRKQISGCCKKAKYFVHDARKNEKGHFYVSQQPQFCKDPCGSVPCSNCGAIVQGNLCATNSMPIFDQDNSKVATIKQLVPLLPNSCCTAVQGPTIQISIHREYGAELTEEQKSQLALFMFTVAPNLPETWSAGPQPLVGRVFNAGLGALGFMLNFSYKGVTTEYLSLSEVFNGEVAGIGDFLDRIRGKVGKLAN
jgi:hypothetical protein